MSRKDCMIVSAPNSGSDWLAGLIARHAPDLRYYEKEFFNPICNPKYRDLLEPVFGCELVSCYRMIGLRSSFHPDWMDRVYRQTWLQEPYNFDKENFVGFQLPFFADRFRLVLLYRSAASLFPPSRLRVLAWYDAIYWAIVHGVEKDPELRSYRSDLCPHGEQPTLEDRARIAHDVYWQHMLGEATRYQYPVIDYDRLQEVSREEVMREVAVGWIPDVVADLDAFVDEIVATRRKLDKVSPDAERRRLATETV